MTRRGREVRDVTWELADGVRHGEVKSAELLDVFLERVDQLNPELNAFCHLDVPAARARAAGIDAAVANGDDPGPWAGVPMGVKELAQVKGWPNTHASKVFEHDIAERDCTETSRLRAAGAVLVGLTTSPEFGSVNWTRSLLHGTTRNPWNPERTPGGSSGGSAAAVASGMMPICTGSDGGGSIRIPSSYSGLFGFKVSFGRVGNDGPFDNGLTSVPGPMARSVRDAARYVDAIAGPTAIDPTSLPRPARSYEDAVVSGDAATQLRGKRADVVVDARLRRVRSRSREARARSRARFVCRRGHRADRRGRQPAEAGPGVGDHLEPLRCDALWRAGLRRLARRPHAGGEGRLRGAARLPDGLSPSSLAETRRPARGDRGGLRRGRHLVDTDDCDDRVRRRGTAAVRDRRPTGWWHGIGAVYRAVQHLGHARCQHSGGQRPRRTAGGSAGGDPPPRRGTGTRLRCDRGGQPPLAQVRPRLWRSAAGPQRSAIRAGWRPQAGSGTSPP